MRRALSDVDASAPPREVEETGTQTTPEVRGRYAPGGGGGEVELGRGGMGRVLLVRDEHLGRVVARKELLAGPGDEGSSSGVNVRFLREARVTARLEHPGIVPVYELGHRADGSLYYTMKHVRGRTLWEGIHAARSMRERLRLLPHFIAVCQAVAYAHSRGVVHRDLKAQNVMTGEFGETVVLDWGLAKVSGHRDLERGRLGRLSLGLGDGAATVVGAALGTPAYMSPEQAEGRLDQVDERSDVWSLGAMLFELVAGRIPFEGATAPEVLQKVKSGQRRSLKAMERNAPAELCAVAEKAMRLERSERYASAVELCADVEAFESGGLVRAHAYSSLELLGRFARRHRASLAIAAVALALLLALGSWAALRVRRERDAADQFATLMLTEVADALEPVQGSAPVVDRVTRAALDFYGATSDPERLTPAQRQRVSLASQRLGTVALGVGQYPAAREHLALALRLSNPAPDGLRDQLQLVRLYLTWGDLEDELDDPPAAHARWNEARRRVDRLSAAFPESAEAWHERSRVEDRLGWQASTLGRRAEAVQHFKQANDTEVEALSRDPESTTYLSGIVWGRVALARHLLGDGGVAPALAELERGAREAEDLLARSPGVEDYQLRAALLQLWRSRVAGLAGRPEREVAHALGLARDLVRAIESQESASVDGAQVLVDVLLQSGEVEAAAARAAENFGRAPSLDRCLQLMEAHLLAGHLDEARSAGAWVAARRGSGTPLARVKLLGAVAALAAGDPAEARRLAEEGVRLAGGEGVGELNFPSPRFALPKRTDADAAAARRLLERLYALGGRVDAELLRSATQP